MATVAVGDMLMGYFNRGPPATIRILCKALGACFFNIHKVRKATLQGLYESRIHKWRMADLEQKLGKGYHD